MALAPVDVVSQVIIRTVGDAFVKPGSDTAPPSVNKPTIVQQKAYLVCQYVPLVVPPGAVAATVEIDLSLFSGQRTDDFLVTYGVEYSLDGGQTWGFANSATAGDNPVPLGFPKSSSQTAGIPRDRGLGILARPFCGAKAPIDVGVKVSFS